MSEDRKSNHLDWVLHPFLKFKILGDRLMRQLTTHLLPSAIHRRLFQTAVRVPPLNWNIGVIAAFLAALAHLMSFAFSPTFLTNGNKPYVVFVTECAVIVWFALGRFYVPNPFAPGIIVATESRTKVSLHLAGKIPRIGELKAALVSTIRLCRSVGIDSIELRSPIFGRPEKERIWLVSLTRLVRNLAPNAEVVVVDRYPMSDGLSKQYRLANRSHTRHAILTESGFAATRIQIRNFGIAQKETDAEPLLCSNR